MASKKIQGITIEIDGNTTKLQNAISNVNSNLKSVNGELNAVRKNLKFDPTNTEMLAQKQLLLKKAIQETAEKLETLKKAQEQMKAKGLDETDEAYRELAREIAKTESQLKGYKKEQDSMKPPKDMENIKKAFASLGTTIADVSKKIVQVSATIATGLSAVVGKAIQSSGQLEQSLGGTEAVFGKYADTIKEKSKEAATNAGLSANAYLEYANKIGSIMQGSGVEISEATDLTTKAMQRASDVASIMGIDVSSAMEAITGAAKGNFTMMDNLGVAMNATSLQAYALEKGITKSYSSMTQAEKVGLAYQMFLEKTAKYEGNYVKENKTLIGSLTSLKASFENLLAGTGDIQDLISNALNFTEIISTQILEVAPTVLDSITQLISNLLPQILPIIMNMLPTLFETASTLITQLVDLISNNVQPIISMVVTIVSLLIKTITANLPTILKAGLDILLGLVDGVIDNLDLVLDAALDIIIALAEGLIDALPRLIEKIPKIIDKICEILTNPDMIIKLGKAAILIIIALGKGLIKALPEIAKIPGEIISDLFNKFKDFISSIDWGKLGKDILNGILNGMMNFGTVVKDTVKKVGNKITKEIKDFFGIASPAKLMKKEIGPFLTQGIVVGMEEEVPKAIRAVDSAMSELNKGIQASVNPIINTSANSNPLIIQIENFNNERETDVQTLAEELEFYRKMSATARGGK